MGMNDEWFDEACEIAMVGGIGTATTLSEYPEDWQWERFRRPIGFITDIDTLIECDDG